MCKWGHLILLLCLEGMSPGVANCTHELSPLAIPMDSVTLDRASTSHGVCSLEELL